jgi:hypothetical protein
MITKYWWKDIESEKKQELLKTRVPVQSDHQEYLINSRKFITTVSFMCVLN